MDYKLILDFGNTFKKAAVFQEDTIVDYATTETDVITILEEFKRKYQGLDRAILSSVIKIDIHLLQYLKSNFKFLFFDHKTLTPLINLYQTPDTLGRDRLAACVGAQIYFPDNYVLVIDAGSSITYEVKSSKGEYLGGAISPGIWIRAKSLNHFTDQLPMVEPVANPKYIGTDTSSSLLSGIVNGAVAEVSSMIETFQNQYDELKIILTGGDAIYFEKRLKYDIFASENLVLEGLNYILDYNEL